MAIENHQLATELREAVQALLSADLHLLQEDVNERSISHRLAGHLGDKLATFHVDAEYNRNLGKSKKLIRLRQQTVSTVDTDATTVYPDIIVHNRGTNENYLIIEIKKAGKDTTSDVEKLQAYTDPNQREPEVKPLHYQLGALLIFPVGMGHSRYEPEYIWFRNGEEIPEAEL